MWSSHGGAPIEISIDENMGRCDGEPEEPYTRVIRRKLDLGRTGFARHPNNELCHHLQRQVLWGTRRLLARRGPPILLPCSNIIRNCKDLLGLFIEERAIITKVRLLHLSVQTLRPQTRTASIAARPNGADMRQLTASRGDCHVSISLNFTRRGSSLVPQFPATAATSRSSFVDSRNAHRPIDSRL